MLCICLGFTNSKSFPKINIYNMRERYIFSKRWNVELHTYTLLYVCLWERERVTAGSPCRQGRERDVYWEQGHISAMCDVDVATSLFLYGRVLSTLFSVLPCTPTMTPPKLSGKGLIKLLFIIFITFSYFFSLQTSKSTKLFHNLIFFFLYLCFTVNFFN